MHRKDAKENRAHILAVARDLFNKNGVKNVSMNQIARESGLGIGTIYRNFNGKSAICYAFLDDAIEIFKADIENILDQKYTPLQNLESVLKRLVILKEDNLELLYEIEKEGVKGQSFLEIPLYEYLHLIIEKQLKRITSDIDCSFHSHIILNIFSSDIYTVVRNENLVHKIIKSFILPLIKE